MTRFIVIGISDAPKPFFPPEVQEIISGGKVFSGGKRHHQIVAPLLPEGAQWIDITVPLDGVFEKYRSISPTLVVFASGDPLFFGFASTIRRRMPEAEVTVFPAFNSLQMLAHRLLMPYHDMRIVSLTGRPWPEFDRALIERAPKIGVLTDREHTPAAIAQRMAAYGYTHYRVAVGQHLGNPEREQVAVLSVEETAERQFEHPNCIILCASPAAALPSPPIPFGIPDAAFALLDGREKMITKMPIRLLTLQALDLSRRRVLWDIGFCTGSVSIEARHLFPHLQVVSFEIRPECEAIIRENARRMGTPGIEVHMGDFLEVTLPEGERPDAVFIGGHGGRLKDIMQKVLTRLAPDGIIVMNSVKIERDLRRKAADRPDSKLLFAEACQALGLEMEEPMRVAINDYHPIEILKCKRLPSSK